MTHNLILVGPMGAGKTTVGRQLAHKLGYKFVDTDHLIEEKSGADIPWIFDVEGEGGFRARESSALDDLKDETQCVIATGGGIVMTPENHPRLKGLGAVVYLSASIEQLWARTSKDKKRPLLQVDDPKARIEQLVEMRGPIYSSLADLVVQTDGRSSRNVVQKIASWFQRQLTQ